MAWYKKVFYSGLELGQVSCILFFSSPLPTLVASDFNLDERCFRIEILFYKILSLHILFQTIKERKDPFKNNRCLEIIDRDNNNLYTSLFNVSYSSTASIVSLSTDITSYKGVQHKSCNFVYF